MKNEKECFKLIFKDGKTKYFKRYDRMLNYILAIDDDKISNIIDLKARMDITEVVLDREEEPVL